MMRHGMLMLAGAVAIAAAAPADSRTIVLTNDDGLTANVKALYDALKAEGHDVIVAVPCTQQSGMGGALRVLQPLAPLTEACINNAAVAGDPGAGPMTRSGLGPDFFYVNGTPVMALLYGLDVVGQARWGRPPDLVLSGPNIGQNTGSIVISSGTVSNAQYAMIRGIAAIALSAGEATASGPDLDNPRSVLVARRSLELLRQLERTSGGGPLLPAGVGLNVNFPDDPASARWRSSEIGSYSRYSIRFVADMRPAAARDAGGSAALPGISLSLSSDEPTAAETDDEAAVVRRDIAVSVMQIAYDAPPATRERVNQGLAALLEDEAENP